MRRFWMVLALGLGLTAARAFAVDPENETSALLARKMAEKVRHELVMMPWLSVFDHIEFQTDGRTVKLTGAVHRPELKSEAENLVKRIEGVERVDNQIRVLPLSPYDDRIRIAAYRRLFSNPMLSRYAMGALPAIQIIVDNGNITLYGTVDSEAERNVAGILAGEIPGVFGVDNEITVAPHRTAKRKS
ncbi:MAG: hypothetical protein KatS3mg004_1642 [Bryobacteraceae bacterium]|nr:MAG: hypothetical protein KatS3mg004_1642 [Bryobacteraceae bacterium]